MPNEELVFQMYVRLIQITTITLKSFNFLGMKFSGLMTVDRPTHTMDRSATVNHDHL